MIETGAALSGITFPKASDPRSASRGEFVYKTLLQAIRSGKLRPGHRIREEEIAQSLKVSRTPVREAIQLLNARRLLAFAPGRGIVVMELTRQQVMELYAMREVLEGAAARFAAQYASDDEIAVLRGLSQEFKAETAPAKLAAINLRFHRAIYDAARNRYVLEALNNLEDALSLLPGTTYAARGRHASGVREHRAIITAIEKRDPDAAEAASRAHIREAQRARLALMAQG